LVVFAILFIPNLYSYKIDLKKLAEKEKKRKENSKKPTNVIDNKTLKKIVAGKKRYGVTKMRHTPMSKQWHNQLDINAQTPDAGPPPEKASWARERRAIDRQINTSQARITELKKLIEEQGAVLMHAVYQNDYMANRDMVAKYKLELAEEQSLLESYKRDLQELHRAARKAGVPPGWLRD
ncbi:MAG: hypothetical protein GY765_16400, partial [bacterium]|nr:hypothetical protein [bacterium]